MSKYPANFDGKAFEALQSKILNINETHQKAVCKLEIERDVATNAIYANRAAAIKAKGPKDFWAQVILAHKDLKEEMIGGYDAEILKSLNDFKVTFRPDGAVRVEMEFESNAFFKESTLWAETDVDDNIIFSGVTWNEGYGPYSAEEEIARLEAEEKSGGAGEKRERAVTDSATRGTTLFNMFSVLPSDPLESIPEANELDEDEVADIIDDFNDAVDDRKELFRALVREVWSFPSQILQKGTVQ